MPDTMTAYGWRAPVGADILKIGVTAIRNLATDIAATIAGLRGGDARYIVTQSATVTASSSGSGTRVPFATAEYTHADVSPFTDFSYFTLNKTGLWTIDGAIRVANVPAGTRVQVAIGDDAGTTVWRAATQMTGAATATLDIPVYLNKRFTAGQKLAIFLYSTAASQPSLDTTSGNNQRSSISLVCSRN